MSIFQGEQLHFEGVDQRREEEENENDAHQRKNELDQLLQIGFVGLDDDISSVDSSEHSSHTDFSKSYIEEYSRHYSPSAYHQEYPVRLSNEKPKPMRTTTKKNVDKDVDNYINSDYSSIKELQSLYEVRLRQLEQLQREMEAEKMEKKQILNKLHVLETEKNGILTTLNQNHKILEEKNAEISSLHQENKKLQDEIFKVEKSKDEIKSQLELSKLEVMSLQQSLALMEKFDKRAIADKRIEEIIETLKAKHEKEMDSIQSKYDEAVLKIEEKDEMCKLLENKLTELDKRHKNILLNNCDSTIRQEAVVKATLDQANVEKIEIMKKYQSLLKDYQELKEELNRYDSIKTYNLLETSSDEVETDSILMMGINRKNEKKRHSDAETRQLKLKEELQRAIMGQKVKRSQIDNLQKQIQLKESQIDEMIENEKILYSQIDGLTKDKDFLMQKLSDMQNSDVSQKHLEEVFMLKNQLSKVEDEKSKVDKKAVELSKQIEYLEEQLKQNDSLKEEYGTEYLKFHDREMAKLKDDAEKALKEKEKIWKDEKEQLLNEGDEVKRLYLEIREKKEKLVQQLHEEKMKSTTLENEKQDLLNQIEKLKFNISQLEDYIIKSDQDKKKLEEHLKAENISLNSFYSFFKNEFGLLRKDVSLQKAAELTKDDVENMTLKYNELERRLRNSFEATVKEIKEENVRLHQELKKKEEALSNLHPEMELPEKLNLKALEEIDRLEKEVENLKLTESEKNDEILKLKSSFQKQLDEELDKLEMALEEKHRKEISEVEEKMKNYSLKYFSEEMEKLRRSYETDISSVRQEEAEKLAQVMKRTENEMKQMAELKKQNVELQNVIHENRVQTSLLMTRWAKEVNEIKENSEARLKEVEELKTKLKSARKTALSYKKKLSETNSAYSDYRIRMKKEFESAEVQIMEKLRIIENEYKIKEEALLRNREG